MFVRVVKTQWRHKKGDTRLQGVYSLLFSLLPFLVFVYHAPSYSYPRASFFILSTSPPISHTMATTTTLLNLPTKILRQITNNLSYAPHLALSYTCRELHAGVDNPNLRPRRWLHSSRATRHHTHPEKAYPYHIYDLLKIELWPEFVSSHHGALEMPDKNDFFACSSCLRVRSAMKFGNYFMTGSYAKYGEDASRRKAVRDCMGCEIWSNKDRGEERFQFGGTSGGYGTVCWTCCKFVPDAEYNGPDDYWTCLCCRNDRLARQGISKD